MAGLKKATILVPFERLPGGHQVKNAKRLDKSMATVMILDSKIEKRPEILLKEIKALVSYCLWLISDFTYYIALSLAPAVAMASAVTKTLHPIMVFSFGVVLSVLWPNFGREKVKRKAILTHLTATAVAVVGIILMQIL